MSTAPQPASANDGSVDELDALPTDELRARASRLARERHDLTFFWDLLKHMPAATDQTNTADASAGGTFETVQEAVELFREWRTGDFGDREPLLRARFIDYLRSGR